MLVIYFYFASHLFGLLNDAIDGRAFDCLTLHVLHFKDALDSSHVIARFGQMMFETRSQSRICCPFDQTAERAESLCHRGYRFVCEASPAWWPASLAHSVSSVFIVSIVGMPELLLEEGSQLALLTRAIQHGSRP